jgi:hypothetical protein
MILGLGSDYDQVVTMLHSLKEQLCNIHDPSAQAGKNGFDVHDCWLAVYKAKYLGWLKLSPNGAFNVETHAHFRKHHNGHIITIVPKKMILFPTPSIMTNDRTGLSYLDGKNENFSPAYYADVLSTEFEVSLVAGLGGSTHDSSAFRDRGIAVEDMPTMDSTAGGPRLLGVLDRFLAVAGAVPGAVALHCDLAGPGGAPVVATLAVAYLTGRLGFQPGAAIAWIRMVHPSLLLADARPAPSGPLPPFPSRQPRPQGWSAAGPTVAATARASTEAAGGPKKRRDSEPARLARAESADSNLPA